MDEDEKGGTTVTQEPGEARTTFQFETPAAPPTEPDIAAIVPDAYKEKEWVKNILKSENPREELFRQYENAQSLIGRQKGIEMPGEGATPEQVKAWHKHIGVPEDVKGYELKPVEWGAEDKEIGDYINGSRNEEFLGQLKAAAHAAGVTPSQLQVLADTYDKAFAAQYKETLAKSIAEEKALNEDFDTQAARLFGDRKTAILDNGKKLLAEHAPEGVKPLIEALDNKALLALSAVLDSVRQRYIKEDSFTGKPGSSGTGMSAKDIQDEGRRLMSLPEFADPMHPRHQQAVENVRLNYARLKQVGQK